MDKSRVLVTGSHGFIGSHLCSYLKEQGHSVTEVDIANPIVSLDIRNTTAMAPLVQLNDVIVHLAGISNIPECEYNTVKAFDTNVSGTLNLLELANKYGKKMIFASSASVYPPINGRVNESIIPNPSSAYALSKFHCENLLYYYFNRSGTLTIPLRFFNVYGPNQKVNNGYSAVIPTFIKAALKGEKIVIHGDGKQTRDFIHVKDVCKAISIAITKPIDLCYYGSPINVGSGYELSINELARIVLDITNSESEISYVAAIPSGLKHSCADLQKINKAFGGEYQPEISMIRGLNEVVESLR